MSKNNYNDDQSKLYCDIVGIDLGTSNAVIAVMKEGDNRVEIIPSLEGYDQTPCCVSYHKGQELVGQIAAAKKWVEPKNTIFDARHFIGAVFDNRLKAFASRRYPFQVVEHHGKKPLFSIIHNGQTLLKRPQDISALVLKKLRQSAERALKCRASDVVQIREAVITVPAYFSMAQKKATIDAATIAGFEHVHLVTEPAAAAYAYAIERQRLDDGYRLLVFHFDYDAFDATLLDARKGEFVQRANDGDSMLGGRDLNILLRDHCAAEIKRRWGYDCMVKPFKAQELLEKCEQLNRTLSHSTKESILLKLHDEEIVELEVSRQTFEQICRPKLIGAMEIVHHLLADSNLTAAQIDEVLLVGGSSRIPLVRSMLVSELGFSPEQLNASENPDLVVAKGAAIVAAQLSKTFKPKFRFPMNLRTTETIPKAIGGSDRLIGAEHENSTHQNKNKLEPNPPIQSPARSKPETLIPLSIGTKTVSGLFDPIIVRNSPIPIAVTRTFSTVVNNQSAMEFEFFEGERPLAEENCFLGKLSLPGLPRGVAGSVSVQLTLEITRRGRLIARATHSGRSMEMNVDAYELRKSSDPSVSRALREAKFHHVADSIEKQRLMASNAFEGGIERSRYKCSKRVHDVCEEFDEWLAKHRRLGTDKEGFEGKHDELKRRLGPSYCQEGTDSEENSDSSK